MRTFKGLENIHSVIDKHVAEWRKENGEPPVENKPRRSIEDMLEDYLGPSVKPNPEPEAPKETQEPEIISIIKQKEEGPHSWLYNEIVKAIKDAAGDGHNTKVIAVIVPVVQSDKELQDLPVNETVTLESPVEISIDTTDSSQTEEPEVDVPEPAQASNEEPEVLQSEEEVQPLTEAIEQEQEQEITEEPEPELEIPELEEKPEEAESVDDILPKGQDEPDAEEAEAFSKMQESLDESLREKAEELAQEAQAVESEPEAVIMPEIPEYDESEELAPVEEEELELEPLEEDEEISQGEPLEFTEIPLDEDEEDIAFQEDPEQKQE